MPRMYKESNNLIAIKIQFENGQYSQVNDQQVPRLKKKKTPLVTPLLLVKQIKTTMSQPLTHVKMSVMSLSLERHKRAGDSTGVGKECLHTLGGSVS